MKTVFGVPMVKYNSSSKEAQKWKIHKMKAAGINVEEVFSDDEILDGVNLIYNPPKLPSHLENCHLQHFTGMPVYKEGTEISKIAKTPSKYLETQNRIAFEHKITAKVGRRIYSDLPIYKYEDELMCAIRSNQVLVVVGETGSGKSTVIPQFLYKAGYHRNGIIGCTQPRRAAAINLAKTVEEKLGFRVGYTIRFEDTTTKDTAVKYMTEGVLLREIRSDPLLRRFSVVILDEAHERSVNFDICICLLKDVLRRRPSFKLIVMSATLQVSKFCDFFHCPSFSILGRPFKTNIEYLSVNVDDYVEWIVKKVLLIHKEKEKGDILVFVTGKEDVDGIVEILNYKIRMLELNNTVSSCSSITNDMESRMPASGKHTCGVFAGQKKSQDADGTNTEIDNSELPNNTTKAQCIDNDDAKKNINNSELLDSTRIQNTGLLLMPFPLYSLLSEDKQHQIFKEDPSVRKCIVSTNIAETSLTIPNIKYVIDSGLQKLSVYDYIIGERLILCPVSQANADQRAGRAGRMFEGTCYRMYTKNTYENELLASSVPEIQSSNIANVVLTLLSIGVRDLEKLNMVDPPPVSLVRNSLVLLRHLEAIDDDGQITELGLKMAELSIDPPLAKLIFTGTKYSCVREMIILASLLSVENIQTRDFDRNDPIVDKNSDFITLLRIYHLYNKSSNKAKLCTTKNLNARALEKASKLIHLISGNLGKMKVRITNSAEKKDIEQCILDVLYYNVARRHGNKYVCYSRPNKCKIHFSSVITNEDLPPYVVFYKCVVTKDEYLYCCSGIDVNMILDTGHFSRRVDAYTMPECKERKIKYPTFQVNPKDEKDEVVILDIPLESLYERYIKYDDSEEENVDVRRVKRVRIGRLCKPYICCPL